MKKKVVKLLLFTTYIAFLLLMLEASYRFVTFGWNSFSIAKMNSVHNIISAGILQYASDPEVLFEFKPGLTTYFKLARFETNSQGLRDKEYTKSKAPDAVRVAVVGDSFTMPSGVDIEDAYHTLLEERFNEESDGGSYEFINFSVGAYSLRQYWAVIRAKVLEYDPDLILIGFCAENDHLTYAARRSRRYNKVPEPTYPFYESFVIKALKASFGPSRYRIRQGLSTAEIVITGEQKEHMGEYFSEIGAWSHDRQIPVVTAYISNRPREPAAVEELAVRNGLYFVDVTSSFVGTKLEDYIIYSLDGHPNVEAHRIFAQRIYDYLQELDLLTGPKRLQSQFPATADAS